MEGMEGGVEQKRISRGETVYEGVQKKGPENLGGERHADR